MRRRCYVARYPDIETLVHLQCHPGSTDPQFYFLLGVLCLVDTVAALWQELVSFLATRKGAYQPLQTGLSCEAALPEVQASSCTQAQAVGGPGCVRWYT